jgi:putative tryptophan/tyrosine transport system substrate-binding protein
MITRRELVKGAVAAAVVSPLVAEAQPVGGKIPRIGFLQRARNENVDVFIQALRAAGYIDGQNTVVEIRIYQEAMDRIAEVAQDLVARKCDVIVAAAPYAIKAALTATRTIPIVGIDLESDPVASGWVRSLSRPGGNLTGLFLDLPELGSKQIQLLREAVPKLSRVAVLWDSTIGDVQFRATEAAGREAGLAVHSLAIQHPRDFQDAFDRAAREVSQGVIVLSSPLINEQRARIGALALKRRLPTISLFTTFPQSGTLMAYGPNLQDLYKRAPSYVDKILKGARAGELPIERPTTFEFVINLKTAKALGLTIPPSLLLRADQVIE